MKNATRAFCNRLSAAPRDVAEVKYRGTPRWAKPRLRWVRDCATSKATGDVTLRVAQAALEMLGSDTLGLDPQDRKYLETIHRVFQGGPVGVEAVAHTMNVAVDTLEDEVEPFLLRTALLVRTPRGRRITAAGCEHLGLAPRPSAAPTGQRQLF